MSKHEYDDTGHCVNCNIRNDSHQANFKCYAKLRESKHTPEPWRKVFFEGKMPQVFAKDVRVATVTFDCDVDLLVAAPELLDELRETLSLLAQLTIPHPSGGFNKMLCERMDSINDILKKVEEGFDE